MARRRSTARSSTEKHVVGDLAFRELLNRAMPLLAPADRKIIDLLQNGSTTEEVALLMHVPDEASVDARITHAHEDLARACRTVAATASLLEEGSPCREFARYAACWQRLLKRRELLQVKLAETGKSYQRFAVFTDMTQPYYHIDNYPWSRAKFLAAKKKAKEAFDIAQTEARKLPELQLRMEDIGRQATEHAAVCVHCQREVLKLLGQDWSPF
jgi:hypothetical protein